MTVMVPADSKFPADKLNERAAYPSSLCNTVASGVCVVGLMIAALEIVPQFPVMPYILVISNKAVQQKEQTALVLTAGAVAQIIHSTPQTLTVD